MQINQFAFEQNGRIFSQLFQVDLLRLNLRNCAVNATLYLHIQLSKFDYRDLSLYRYRCRLEFATNKNIL